ncbi:MAG: hypothetical protein MUC96_36895 [Myxococcaceae bacterium]|nr:hypothetical protein [Myxococcaceae bacterium]
MNRVLLCLALALGGCPKRVEGPSTARAIRLLAETAERETTQLTELRGDLEVDTRDFDRTPHVVATGETPPFSAEGVDVRLYGDEAGTQGFQVDNFILLEVVGADGKVLRTAIVGFTDPVSQGKETLDNLGRRAFAFEPGELNLSPLLPERGLVRVRATVLDYYGVGRVTDVFLRLEPRTSAGGAGDDLRGQ